MLVKQLKEGMLAPEALEAEVRKILFAPIDWADPFRKLKESSIKRNAIARGDAVSLDKVVFENIDADTLTPEEYATLEALRRDMPEADVRAMWTVVTCGNMEQRYPKARVMVEFGGRLFRREVDLREIVCHRCGTPPSNHKEGCEYWAGPKGSNQRASRREP
jgi:hypothetical protein